MSRKGKVSLKNRSSIPTRKKIIDPVGQCLLAGRPTCLLQYLDVIIHEEPLDCENITVEVQEGPSSSKPTGFALFDSNTCTNVITEKRRTSVCFGQYKTNLWLPTCANVSLVDNSNVSKGHVRTISVPCQLYREDFMLESSTCECQEPGRTTSKKPPLRRKLTEEWCHHLPT